MSFILFTLLIACCGNLTPHVVDWGKSYKTLNKDRKSNVLALIIGLVSKLHLFARNFNSKHDSF